MEAQMRRRIDMAVRPAPLAQGMQGHRWGREGAASTGGVEHARKRGDASKS
jgi:hypothetical protein